MNILILGGGGREHALAWAIQQNPKCDRLLVAPGNAGIAQIAMCVALDILDGAAVVALAQAEAIDFVIIGPEAPLVAGVADSLRAAGILCFGPSAAAARLEGSKAFTKEVCAAVNAPTAGYERFSDLTAAKAYVSARGAPIVIKADGLAAGKGVTVAMTLQEAETALEHIFESAFKKAGTNVIIEDMLIGEEASFFCLVDGETVLPLGSAQDHKRVGEGETGPNTGGMGAYSPAPVMTPEMTQRVLQEIIHPSMAEMVRRGTPFQGVLFAGLMITADGPSLIEYNVRFGDPECQCLMMRLGAQTLDLMLACSEGRLSDAKVHWAEDHAVTVVLAAQGYPGGYETGTVIKGLEALPQSSQSMIFHAGTRKEGGHICANGGRVLNVTTRADTLRESADKAYAMAAQIDWPEGFYRKDIGWRALRR